MIIVSLLPLIHCISTLTPPLISLYSTHCIYCFNPLYTLSQSNSYLTTTPSLILNLIRCWETSLIQILIISWEITRRDIKDKTWWWFFNVTLVALFKLNPSIYFSLLTVHEVLTVKDCNHVQGTSMQITTN